MAIKDFILFLMTIKNNISTMEKNVNLEYRILLKEKSTIYLFGEKNTIIN